MTVQHEFRTMLTQHLSKWSGVAQPLEPVATKGSRWMMQQHDAEYALAAQMRQLFGKPYQLIGPKSAGRQERAGRKRG